MQEAVNNYIAGMTNFNFINFTEAHFAINVTLSSFNFASLYYFPSRPADKML